MVQSTLVGRRQFLQIAGALGLGALAECTNDITHSWAPQHLSWNGGAMDDFVRVHMAQDGAANGPLTMGYYARSDLAYYYALADAFTICDGYHCSVLGPTDPNRLYSMTATIDPDGKNGGPLVETLSSTRAQATGTFTWTTMPEQLQARGISWKIYSTADGNAGDNVLTYFKQYQTNPLLSSNAFTPTFPGDFRADCAAGTLPQSPGCSRRLPGASIHHLRQTGASTPPSSY